MKKDVVALCSKDNMGFTYYGEKPLSNGHVDIVNTEESGGIQGNKLEKCWTITRVIVTEDLRKQGIAKKLMAAVCEKADTLGINLEVDASPYSIQEDQITEEKLIQFFEQFGFVSQKDCARNMVRMAK